MLLITGITGHSGKYFLQHLMDDVSGSFFSEYHNIRIIARNTSDTSMLNDSGINFEKLTGNLTDENFLSTSLKGVNTVLHIAGIGYSHLLVKKAAESNVKRMVLVHTTGIYSKYKAASSGYIEIEKEIHKIAIANNIVLTILRPTMIYGSVSDKNIVFFIKMIDYFKLVPIVNHAKYDLQPIHASDLGKAYYQILLNIRQTENKDYILSGKSPIKLIDIFKVIENHLGVQRKYISIPFPIAYLGAWLVFLVTATKKDYREKVQRLCESRAFSHDEATRDFGFDPISFEDGVMSEINEWRSRLK